MDGQTIISYANGDRRVGHYKDRRKHGNSTFTHLMVSLLERNGKMVK